MMNDADWMRSSVSDRRMRHSYWSCVRYSHGSCMSYSDSGSCMRKRFLVHHSIETVHWVGGVFHGASGTIGFDEGVAALHYITIASFVLVFDVTGDGVLKIHTKTEINIFLKTCTFISYLDVICVTVLWMRIVLFNFCGNSGRCMNSGDSRCCVVNCWCCVVDCWSCVCVGSYWRVRIGYWCMSHGY